MVIPAFLCTEWGILSPDSQQSVSSFTQLDATGWLVLSFQIKIPGRTIAIHILASQLAVIGLGTSYCTSPGLVWPSGEFPILIWIQILVFANEE